MFEEMPSFKFTETGIIQSKVGLSSISTEIPYLLHLFDYYCHQ